MKRLLAMLITGLLLAPAGGHCAETAKEPAVKGSADKSHDKMLRMLGGGAGADKEPVAISGKAVEVLESGGYTYVSVEKDGVRSWVAVPTMKVTVGAQVAFAPGNEMLDFESKSLNRKFARIIFSGGPAVPEAAAKAQPETVSVSGKVVEVLNGGGYTYVTVEKAGEKTYVAVPQMQMAVGRQITFAPGMEMNNFQSKALNRTYAKIIFSSGPETPQKVKGSKNSPQNSPGSKGAAVAADGKIKVEKASGPNAYTIAEIFKLKGKLDKKKVSVRGKVVKVAAGIMNRNWIHLQDGSGSKKQGNHDLVATSATLPEEGVTVTVTGILARDKDFGGGYKYAVIVEKAEIAVE
jgi:hypothetical protein